MILSILGALLGLVWVGLVLFFWAASVVSCVGLGLEVFRVFVPCRVWAGFRLALGRLRYFIGFM